MADASRKNLNAIATDGMAFGLMVGMGEAYVPAFALAMGIGEVAVGWMVSLPLLFGAVIQLVSPIAVARLGSLRWWVVGCAAIQSLSLLAYVLVAVKGWASTPVFYLIAVVYWAAGLATGPAWNTWVGTLVPARVRSRFFAPRSRIAQGAVLCGLVVGGLALQYGEMKGVTQWVFIILFSGAFLARASSVFILASQDEAQGLVSGHRMVPIAIWLGRLRGSNDGKLLLYMLSVQCVVQVSGPFFTPYMLRELQFSYAQYLTLLSVSFLSKMVILPFVGRIVHRIGPRRVLMLGGLGIVPLSGLWLLSDSFFFLLGVQVVAGALWAVYELTTFLLLFEHLEERERTSILTTYNFMHAVATVCGALVGGAVLRHFNETQQGYMVIFGLSVLLRLTTIPLLFRFGEVRLGHFALAVRALSVRPNAGSMDAPIVVSLADDEEEEIQEV